MPQLTIQQAFDLACQHQRAGRLQVAEQIYRQILAQHPQHADSMHNLAIVAMGMGQTDVALNLFRQTIALRPTSAEAYNNLANVLRDTGRLDEAITVYRQAILLGPNLPDAHNNFGIALAGKGQLIDAIAAFRQAILLRPDFPKAHNNLGNVLKDVGRPDEAIAACRQAIALKPDYGDAYTNLGNVLKDTARGEEAVAVYRQAIALNPGSAAAHSNLIFLMHFRGFDAQAIAEEQRRWNRQHAEPLANLILTHSNDRNPDRILRVGYISPDFRNHCQAFFVLPLLANHDRSQVSVYCYSVAANTDEITTRHQGLADVWRDCRGMPDQDIANAIRADQIDILVDLSLHMANSRLLVFARKPVPVQVTWLGYPASTGVTAIDYRLSDPYIDPPGRDESIYSERTVRLPDTFWCYDPLDRRDVLVNPLPAKETGTITFGCLNNFCKINDELLALWAQVLKQVENSRLLLLTAEGSHRQLTLDQFSQEGIDPGRIEFVPMQSRRAYLELYHRIDIGLDSFPYNGHTTSLDSFWMGVPVVTLVGQMPVARAGWCQLSNLGLAELAGQTPEQFVQIAVSLANDLPRLSDLRRTLRKRMEQSPLMDAPKFAHNIEAAYRQMWRTWRASDSAKS